MDIFKHTQKQNNKVNPILWLPTTQGQPEAVLYAKDIQITYKEFIPAAGKMQRGWRDSDFWEHKLRSLASDVLIE